MNAAMTGSLAIIFTAHVPYLRAAGRRPDGEDALHETIAYALVPTINTLHDLRDQGLHPRVALACSPLLLEQLADSVVQKHFVVWMDEWLERAAAELARREQAGEHHHAYLARFYLDWGQHIAQSFDGRYGRNLVAALRALCEDGIVEPLASAATHAFLPLLGRAESVRAQLDVGALTITRLLGRKPRGLWLPDLGYHPSLNQQVIATGLRYMVVDPSSVQAEAAVPHLRPRWVMPRQLIALLRDPVAATYVLSPELGYVGDPLYLAPRRDAAGLAWHRNDVARQDALYDPYHAFRRVQEHANHFVEAVAAELGEFRARHDRPGLAVLPLDAELLGRSWFEGPAWLRAVFERLASQPGVSPTTPAPYLRAHRPRQGVTLREGAWSEHGDAGAWRGHRAMPLWQALHEAEDRVAGLVGRFPHARGARERALTQAVRELLLAQASDWPLLLNQGNETHEALGRPLSHLQRCEQLCALAERDEVGEQDWTLLDELEEFDNPFPHLNYRVFAA